MKIALDNFTVEETGIENIPYYINGPKNSSYALYRNIHNHKLFFAINRFSNKLSKVGIGRWQWFTDKNGILEPVKKAEL